MASELIRIGDTIINLDNVMVIDLNYMPEGEEEESPHVVIEFIMRGMDELDEGQNFTSPYLRHFKGAEAEAIRRYFKKKHIDLLADNA